MNDRNPSDDALPHEPPRTAAERAFEAGNYYLLREELKTAQDALPEKLTQRVRMFQRATTVDPLHVVLLALCTVAFLVIFFSYLKH